MRKVIAKGLSDDFYAELSRDVDLIVEVMQLDKSIARDEITFVVVFNGSEFVDFINKHKLDKELVDKIDSKKEYEIIAYDW